MSFLSFKVKSNYIHDGGTFSSFHFFLLLLVCVLFMLGLFFACVFSLNFTFSFIFCLLVCCVSTGSAFLKQQTWHALCNKSIPSNIYHLNSRLCELSCVLPLDLVWRWRECCTQMVFLGVPTCSVCSLEKGKASWDLTCFVWCENERLS